MLPARNRWLWLVGAGVALPIALASLMPANMQVRTGLHWLTEHFIIYALATFAVCLVWPRPLTVGSLLAALSGLLELAQGLTPDRVPDLPTALAGAAGAFSAALLAILLGWLRTTYRLGLVLGLILLASGGTGKATPLPDREFQECSGCPVMVGIPAGSFLMGSPASEVGRFNSEGPQHEVTVRAFAIGKFDVASEQFISFLKETGYQPRPCNALLDMGWTSPGGGKASSPYDADLPRWPAACLNQTDAEHYIGWLNSKVRKEHPNITNATGPYRLPSEAEWEYAARGGTTTARWWGESIGTGKANCNGCGSPYDNSLFADVTSFGPNPFGLYGVLGNAWQWTADCWHPSYAGAPSDGSAWVEKNCDQHVIRGGSWHNLPAFVRSAARAGSGGSDDPDYSGLAGFRVARDLP